MQYVVAILVGLVLAEVATLITTIYLHRVLSHRSIRLHPAMTMFMRFGTWMLTSISPRSGWPSTANTTTSATSKATRTAPTSRGTGRSCSPTSTTTVARPTTTTPSRSTPGSPLRPPRQGVAQARHFGLLPNRRDPGPHHGPWTRPRGARDARGRVPGAERRDQRRRPHLRLQELRE